MAARQTRLSARQNPPFVPFGIFPLTRLPPELTMHIASYLTPRGIFALLLTSRAFEHVIYVFTSKYTREEVVFEDRLQRCYTPLQYFCSRGVERVVKRMLERGVDPNYLRTVGNRPQISPLIHAISFRSANIVSLLLQYGACVNAIDLSPRKLQHFSAEGNTALHIAVGPPHSIPPRRTYNRAAYSTREAELPRIVQLLLDAGAEVNKRNGTGHTALHIACATRFANPLLVRALIDAGAIINITADLVPGWGERRVQPIHYAANAGHIPIVRMLLDAGVNVEARTRQGTRPLDLAVLHMRLDLVEFLVREGADVSYNAGDKPGDQTPLGPVEMVSETTTWGDFKSYLRARGVLVSGRSMCGWWVEGKEAGRTKMRSGVNIDGAKWAFY